jgi:tetratricopeptide (TPR) repeat protein
VLSQGRHAEAEVILREAYELVQQVYPDGSANVALARNTLGRAVRDQGRLAEAEELFRAGLDEFRRTFPPTNPDVGIAMVLLADVLMDQRKLGEPESLLRDALVNLRTTLTPGDPRIITAVEASVKLEQIRGNAAAALPFAAELYESAQAAEVSPPAAALRVAYLGPCLVELKRYAEAERPLRDAYKRLDATDQRGSETMRRIVTALAAMCEHTNRPDEAKQWRAELASLTAPRPATQP